MISGIKHILEKSIPLPITTASVQMARQFANQQPTPQKQEQVYLNTLAVCAVNDYMQMMDIPTDLNASDSWNPAIRLYTDAADLQLTGLGHLECRPIGVDALQNLATSTFSIPPDVPDERIGVVVVAIDDSNQQATLLGFTQTVTMGEFPISQLQTLDDLLLYLDRLPPKPSVNLSQWLQNIFDAGWQSVETLFNSESGNLVLEYGWRKQPIVKGAKLIDLGMQLGSQSIALLVAIAKPTEGIAPESGDKVSIRIQVHPVSGTPYLPANLKLALLNETGELLQEVPSRSLDNFIQLPRFIGSPGERFKIQISLDSFTVNEEFVI